MIGKTKKTKKKKKMKKMKKKTSERCREDVSAVERLTRATYRFPLGLLSLSFLLVPFFEQFTLSSPSSSNSFDAAVDGNVSNAPRLGTANPFRPRVPQKE